MAVDRDTVIRVARLARINVPEGDIDTLAGELSNILEWIEQLNEIDTDGNMEIDFDEFVTMMSRKPDALRHPEEIRAAFKMFEKSIDDSSGQVRQSALIHALTNLSSEKLSRAE